MLACGAELYVPAIILSFAFVVYELSQEKRIGDKAYTALGEWIGGLVMGLIGLLIFGIV